MNELMILDTVRAGPRFCGLLTFCVGMATCGDKCGAVLITINIYR